MDFTRTNLKGLLGASAVTLSANMTLPEKDRAFVIGINATAASKIVTLDLPDGAVCIVANAGASNAFTLKNVSGDTGTSIAAGKVYLVIASQTADGSKVLLLNDGNSGGGNV